MLYNKVGEEKTNSLDIKQREKLCCHILNLEGLTSKKTLHLNNKILLLERALPGSSEE